MNLSQLIAILQSVKANAAKGKTEVYQLARKSSLFQKQASEYPWLSETLVK